MTITYLFVRLKSTFTIGHLRKRVLQWNASLGHNRFLNFFWEAGVITDRERNCGQPCNTSYYEEFITINYKTRLGCGKLRNHFYATDNDTPHWLNRQLPEKHWWTTYWHYDVPNAICRKKCVPKKSNKNHKIIIISNMHIIISLPCHHQLVIYNHTQE